MPTGATSARPGDVFAERLRAVQDLFDRGEALEGLASAVDASGLSRGQRRRLHAEVLAGPLGARLDSAAKRGPERRREAIDALRPFLATVEPRVKLNLPVGRRLAYHLIETRDPTELAESEDLAKLAAAEAEPSRRVRRGLRWYAELPVPAEPRLLRLRRADLVPVTQVDDISWGEDGRLRITGHAYLAGLSVRSRRFNRATVVLYGPRWLPPIALRTTRIHRPQATHGAAEPGCNYDWAGFTAELRPFSLRWRAGIRAVVRGAKRLLRGRAIVRDTTTWRTEIVIWSRMARATGPLRGPTPGRTERPDGLELKPGLWVRPVWTSDRALQVVLQPTRAELLSARLTGGEDDSDTVELVGFLPGRPFEKGRARLGGYRVAADFTPVDGGTRFRLTLPAQTLLKEREVRRLWVEPKGLPAATVQLTGDAEARLTIGEREITVLRDRRDRVTIAAHRIRPFITSATWRDGTLTLEGDYPDPDPGPRELVLRHTSGLTFHIPLERRGPRFSARLAPGAMPRFGGTVPLPSGPWSLTVNGLARGRPISVPVRFDHAALATLDESPVEVDGRTYQVESTRFDVPMIVAAERIPDDEKGAAGNWALRRVFYPAERTREPRDATVYVSFDGRFYADNPRAVYEERLRRGDDREHIWVVRDGAFIPPDSAMLGSGPGITPRVVREGGREHYEALARSRYIVTNSALPTWFRAREDQVVVQTWNGTPLKRIGNDQAHMARDPKPPVWHRQAAEVRNWDLLVAQSPWAGAILRRAFAYDGEMLESGLPRNDLIAVGDRDDLAAAIRRRLGVPEGKKLVLYAPTSRDNDRKNSSVRFDLVEMRKALGYDHVLLVRGHPLQAYPSAPGLAAPDSAAARAMAAESLPVAPAPATTGKPTPKLLARRAAVAKAKAKSSGSGHGAFALDVTTYPDIAELLLVADVLITDYSAVMFDFVVTGKPVILFAPDLQRYDANRGLYLDLATEAPGPLLFEQSDVVDALRSLDTVTAEYADRYAAFVRLHAPHDDGKATLRLVDHVFGQP
ncbi:CDP-glycerol glycerophosphotransferase family protein [Thermopolyspora sp. NPDC052614]|uniref:CDP-glycerol glycerophosphotransferase family protein n=1 Tax=Thermopolyspora sp. NPDC052614 TaxID=3155682 RepID=UPI0034121666